MKTKSVFVALCAIATLALGSSSAANAKSPDTEKTKEATPPPTITVKVKPGDTLEAIATAHDTTFVRLFNANPAITHPDTINTGDEITIPTKDAELTDRYSQLQAQLAAAAPVQVSAAPATTTTQRQYTSTPVNSSSYYVGNGMWCTDWVHSKRPDVPIYSDAGYSWISSAQAEGKATGTSARPGAVAVTNGHVAYVESVNSDGSYVVSEMGWDYQAGKFNQRTVQPGTFGQFIY